MRTALAPPRQRGHHAGVSAVAPGTVLAGKYRVTKVLGEGGMGVVVAAVHVQLEEPVALKFMLPTALGSAEAIARFLREARAAVKLKSEHVARVSDVGTLETGAPYIVMEYLEGSDLSAALTLQGPLSPAEAVDYIVQACDALAEAHSLGIVHRDLKPANLFVTRRRDGSPLVKVLDFGISKSSALNEQGGAGSLTKTGGLMGSPVYMSPEQMRSAKDVDARTDIWALGIILYELVGGRRPFDSETLGGIMSQVLTTSPTSLQQVRPGLPPVLYDVVDRCLEKDRDRRWANVGELVSALRSVAPPRSIPLIERISGASLAKTAFESSTSPNAAGITTANARTGQPSKTAPGWTDGGTGPKASGGRGSTLVVAGVAAVALIGGVAFMVTRHDGHKDDGPPVSAASAPVKTTETISPPIAPLPQPEPAVPPSTSAAANDHHAPQIEASAASNEPAPPISTVKASGTGGSHAKKGPPPAATAPAAPHTASQAKPPAKPPSDLLDTSN